MDLIWILTLSNKEEGKTKTNKILSMATGIVLLICSGILTADEENTLKLKGNFEIGYRHVDVDGNKDKYYEDLNIRKGPRLLDLNFDILPSGNYKKYFDLFNVYASTIGGDPFESYGFILKKFRAFNLRYGHRKATYFHQDIILPPGLADVSTTTGGDFHHFSFDRKFDNLFLDVSFSERAKFFVAFDRQQKTGESTTTLDLSRDEFELDKPIHELKTEYKAGLQVNLDKVDFYLEGSYNNYENSSRIFLPGFSVGENPAGNTEASFFELIAPYEFTMPMVTARVNARPTNRIKATAAYTYSDLDMELDYSESAIGVSYNALPLENDPDHNAQGTAAISRKFNLFDFDFSFRAHDKIFLIGGLRYSKLDQDAESNIVRIDTTEEDVDSIVDIESTIYEVGTQVLPYKTLALTGGIRWESRDTHLEHDTTGEEKKTERTTFFINANYKLANKLSVMGEYERGSFENPFTLMSPTDLNRFKIRVKIMPTNGLSLMLSYLRRDIDNDESGGKFNCDGYGFDIGYNVKEKLYASVGYSRQDIDTSISNLVIFPAPPWDPTGGGQSLWSISYESGNNIFRGSLKYKINENFAVGAMAYYYKNSGTWKLDWTTTKTWLKYTLDNGYSIFLSYKYNNYDESLYDFDDYSSNIFTVGFGYKF
jgi:hypothetical protein